MNSLKRFEERFSHNVFPIMTKGSAKSMSSLSVFANELRQSLMEAETCVRVGIKLSEDYRGKLEEIIGKLDDVINKTNKAMGD